ncbi:MAG: YetF domain-containing protein [Chitinophagaceae bacterium]
MSVYMLDSLFNWKELLMGSENWSFLLETALRSFIMFVVIVLSLRILGKRGVKQLSVFELVVIIGLGSAAGDPMFYRDVGLLPALVVFIMIISLYRFIMYCIGKNNKFERLIEGSSVCLISEGRFSIENFKKETLAQDEFFAELRLKGVMHLGQVELGIIEITGEISLFFYEDDKVQWGLPILPDLFRKQLVAIAEKGIYSCAFCGHTNELTVSKSHSCSFCQHNLWVRALKKTRVK